MSQKKYSIAIVGQVGAGKSTLAKALSERLEFDVIEEPWEQNSYIPNFPENAFSCQFKQMELMADVHKKMKVAERKRGVVVDRMFHEVYDVFTRQFRSVYTREEHQALYDKHNRARKELPMPKVIVGLEVAPGICWERIRSRGRDFELERYSFEYCEEQAFLYGGLFAQLRQTLPQSHHIGVNANVHPEAVLTETLRKLRAWERQFSKPQVQSDLLLGV